VGHVQALHIELGLQGTQGTINIQPKLLHLKLSQQLHDDLDIEQSIRLAVRSQLTPGIP
jgi:hypothetical protein